MILDTYKLQSTVVQLNYGNAYELWDNAGHIARQLSTLWGNLKVSEGVPNQQVLKGDELVLTTGFNQSSLAAFRKRAASSQFQELAKKTFEVWRDALTLESLTRVSARSVFVKDFQTIEEANAHLRSFDVVKWPTEKVFNQDQGSDQNSFDVAFRFQDATGFSVVRVKTEGVKLNVEADGDLLEETIEVQKYRSVIDFDRGVLSGIEASKFRLDEWLSGFVHVMRRDLEKVVRGGM